MTTQVNTTLDFEGRAGIANLGAATASGQPVVFEQLNSALAGIAWKDNVRVSAQVNVNLAAPGSSINSITLTSGDRVLLSNQTSNLENGIYIFNGDATPMTRALDATTFDSLESAVVAVDEGTGAGSAYRQTQVNGVIGTNAIVWTLWGNTPASASESTAGIAEIATQGETDTGTDDTRIVTPLKLKTYAGGAKRYSTNVGDGSATSIAVTHNLGTLDVEVYVRETGGNKRMILCEIRHTDTNTVTLLFDVAPASNALRCTVLG
jgi:hypothetical protein